MWRWFSDSKSEQWTRATVANVFAGTPTWHVCRRVVTKSKNCNEVNSQRQEIIKPLQLMYCINNGKCRGKLYAYKYKSAQVNVESCWFCLFIIACMICASAMMCEAGIYCFIRASVRISVSVCLLVKMASFVGQPFYYMVFACCIEVCIMSECTRSKWEELKNRSYKELSLTITAY